MENTNSLLKLLENHIKEAQENIECLKQAVLDAELDDDLDREEQALLAIEVNTIFLKEAQSNLYQIN